MPSKKPKEYFWGSAGIGTGTLGNLSLALAYEFKNKPALITTRYAYNLEIYNDESVTPLQNVNDLGVLYGYKVGKFRFSTGLSRVWGVKRGKFLREDSEPFLYGKDSYESLGYATIGIPAEVPFILSNRDLGIGLTAYGNLNTKRPYGGLNLSFYLGEMK
ncbi:hypothetical protein [Siphonobacter sp. SORGH_AS_0500]|uniref:hypothetical protein n=1 Tax=Siphonobacter sp. SORGH_AS_0500 TaxID=1864824 RepID=UPI002855E807|nr:hypothetical protein [Siphonobacter sp. SORGH_AS_0500]MDR6197713.1 hypothetical protein [Siphonobacter sp. SORGH_AS_0500]